MAEYFAGGHLRFVYGEWRDDNGNPVEIERVRRGMWVHKIALGEHAWFCSECKAIGSPAWKRCPVCETKMDCECDA